MTKAVTGTFATQQAAAACIEGLVGSGFDSADISLVASEEFDRETFGVETHTKLAEGAAIGAGAGGAAGAVVAGLTTVGAITGGAGLVAAGPVVAALAGAGAGAAGGSVIGGLVGAAVPEHEIKHYEDAVERGHVLIGVRCETEEQCKSAKEIFERFDAEKISHS